MFPITFKRYVLISFGLFIGLFMYLLNIYDYYLFHIIMHVTITKASTMIITNTGLIILFFAGKMTLNMFVGRLREIEIEEILDQGRMFLLDTIFFLLFSSPTVDNVEVGAMVLSRYIALILILKLLHLISHIRINHMFELERPKTMNIIRIASLLNILLMIDLSLIFKYYLLLSKDSTLRLWIFFESVSLFISSLISIGKYMVHIIDLKLQSLQLMNRHNDEDLNSNFDNSNSQHNFVWSNKNAVLFYMEVIGDICSLVTYLLFIVLFLLLNPSRIPLYIMGDIFHVLKALYNKLSSFRKYRKLTKNMETKFQEATLEEIERIDTCIVCRDTLYIGSKKIPCGHVFHLDCLKSWFIQQQTCPICRSNINMQEENETNSNNEINVSENTQNDNFDNVNRIQELNINEDINSNNNTNNNTSISEDDNSNNNKISNLENSIKVGFKRVIKSILGEEQNKINLKDKLRNKNDEKTNNSKKIYQVSKHPLLNRVKYENYDYINKSSVEDFDQTLPPQVLSIQPQMLFDMNKILIQSNIKDNREKMIFSSKMCEMYKKNVDIWFNKVSKLIGKEDIYKTLNISEENNINDEIKGDTYSRDCPSLLEGNYMIDPLEDLFKIMKNQSNSTELDKNDTSV